VGKLRRASVAIVAALTTGLALVAVQMNPAVGADATHATLTITKGGDRTGAQTVGPLAGAVFDFYAGTATGAPTSGTLAGTCTTSAAGTCSVNVPGRNTGNQGYWIVERTAPAGFMIAQTLDTGTNANNSSPHPYNQLFTGNVANGTTRTFPVAGTGSAQDSRGNFWADIRNNPALPGHCGLNIAMLIDTSGSIGGDIGNVKNAANGFIDALTGTPSQIALYSFATNAFQRLASTPVSTPAGATTVKNAVNALPNPSGSTNWDQGLFQIAAATTPYDAVIMLTDGNPTVYGPPPSAGPGDHTRFREVENGIFSSNALKAEGTRVVVVGVGSGVTGAKENLAAISGPTAGSDYFQTDYASLSALFRQLALATCKGTISVVKEVIPPRGTPAQGVPTGGWVFDSSTPGVTPASGTTDNATGGVSFTAPLNGAPSLPVTLAEQLQTGFTIRPIGGQNATCTDANNQPVTSTNSGALGFTVSALANDAITCVVFNTAPTPPASVVVNKSWDINGTTFADGHQPVDFQAALSLTGQTDPEFGVTFGGYSEGDSVTVGETVDENLLPPGCTNTASGDLGDHTLAAGLNSYQILNTVTCVTTLKLVKSVDNPFGPPEPADSWTLSAFPMGSGTPTVTGTTGVNGPITADLPYSLGETSVPGYKQEKVAGATIVPPATGSWHCVLLIGPPGGPVTEGPEFDGLNGTVTVTLGQNAQCTAINNAQPAHLTLIKVVQNTHGGTAKPTAWTLNALPQVRVLQPPSVSGKSGTPAVTGAEIFPGVPYTLSETNGPANYAEVGTPTCVDDDTQNPVDMTGSTFTATIDQNITCTFTNQDIATPPTTPPPTSPPPLPVTGTSFGPVAGVGVLIFLGGAVLFVVARRRRTVIESA
jgi:Prealbumin-like fold domain/von Willebrand factor type A domain